MPTDDRPIPPPSPTPAADAGAAPPEAPPSPVEKLDAAVESVPYRTWLIAIVLLAVLLQSVLVMTSPPIARDGITFVNIARALATHPLDVMRQADQHPGFPALIVVGRALVLPFVSADSVFSWIWGARLAAGVFGVLVVLAAWRLADRTFGRRAAIVAAACVAILPVFRRNAADALSDSPHLFLYLVAASLAIEGVQRRQRTWFLLAGAASGLAFWVRPEGLSVAAVVAAFLPLWAWRTKKLRARSVVEFAALTLLAAAVVAAPYVLLSGKLSSKITHKDYLYGESMAPSSPLRASEEERAATGARVAPAVKANGPAAQAEPIDRDDPLPAGDRHLLPVAGAAVRAIAGVTAQALCWVMVAPLLAAPFVRDPQKDRGGAHALLLSMVGFHTLLVGWLFWAGGYVTERHVMVIVALAMPRLAAALVMMADWMQGRVFMDRDVARAARRRDWILGGLVAAVAIVAVPRSLDALHPDAAPSVQAALELRVYAKPGDQVLSNCPYVPFYSQLPGRVITKWDVARPGFDLSRVGSPCRFIVFDTDLAPFRKAWLDQIADRYERLTPTGVTAKNLRAYILRPALPLVPPPAPPRM